MSRIASFDCFCGAAGDMILGSLVDAGLEPDILAGLPERLGLQGVSLHTEEVRRGAIAATKLVVELPGHTHDPGALAHHHGRTLPQILELLDRAEIPGTVRTKARQVFEQLARAEAAVHGMALEEVHFHEVGADDALIDIVGVALALEHLEVTEVHVGTFNVGTGTVETEHGVLPLPCPATAKMLEGHSTCQLPISAELLTPTGAAILTTLGTTFGPMGEMTLSAVGYGAGSRELPERANVVRVMLGVRTPQGDESSGSDQVWELTTLVDDCTAEEVGYLQEKLMNAGALDVAVASVLMKKGRPGFEVRLLARENERAKFEKLLFTESGTLGIRRQLVERTILDREQVSVMTGFGPVRVKVGRLGQEQVVLSPEYEDCRQQALAHGVTLREVRRAAVAAFRESLESD